MFHLKLERETWLAVKLIGGTVAAVLAIGGLALWLKMKPVLDKETLCPPAGEKYRVAVLVDKSDKWETNDVARVKELLRSIHREVPTQGRLTIYAITGEGAKARNGRPVATEVKRVFDVCNPGSVAECNALYRGCKQVARDYRRAFEVPLQQLEATLAAPGESSNSPILETIGAMVIDTKSEALKMHIVSDFMENHYKFVFTEIVPLDTEMIEQYPLPKTSKITVDGHFIQRRMHSVQLQKAVQNAWTGYFDKQGIKVEFRPIFASD